MKNLNQKIEARKRSLSEKKSHLKRDYRAVKRKLTANKRVNLTMIGGVLVGFLLLPKKYKIIKTALKAYTMAATVRGLFDLIPHSKHSSHSHPREFHAYEPDKTKHH